MKKKIGISLFITVIGFQVLHAQADSTYIPNNTPSWAKTVLASSELYKNYSIIDTINPFYFEGDYTSDGLIDIAFIVRNKQSDEVGTFIINGGKNISFVLGAGKPIGIGTNINSCDRWFVYREKYIYNFNARKKKTPLKHTSIEFPKTDQRSIIVYWDKHKYKTAIKDIP